jgi:hypothetical protein
MKKIFNFHVTEGKNQLKLSTYLQQQQQQKERENSIRPLM